MDFTSVAVGNEPDWTQDAFLTNWEERVRREPQGVTFSIAAPKSEFFFGEVIPFQLKFTATEPRAFLADSRLQGRVGRMNYVEEFFVDQAALAADPLQGLPSGEGRMGGGPVILSEKPFGFERVLNEQIRFRQPGEYRIYVISRRVRQVEEPGHSDYYLHLHERGKAVELASNVLTLKILPAPPSG